MAPLSQQLFRYCLEYGKEGPARFLSHLDLQAGIERALRRAGLPLAFSQGFHPRPRFQCEEALPLGWTSEREQLWVELVEPYPPREALRRLRATAPPGLEFQRFYPVSGRPRPARRRRFRAAHPDLPADPGPRLAAQFPPGTVRAAPSSGAWVFELRPAGGEQAPSMKRVLRALLGPGLQAEAEVRRLLTGPEREP